MKVIEKGVPFASEVEVGSGLLWLPYKNILETITRSVTDSGTDAFIELENCVRKYKPDFINFLSHKGRSSSDRELLKKSMGEAIFLKGQDAPQALHPRIVNETILLSDIFDINEFLALDLLVTADTIKEDYPGWARGLIAVLLYYEGRFSMIQSVSVIVSAIPGKAYPHSGYPRVVAIFQKLLGYIFKEDTMDKLVGLFEKSEVKPQLDLLDSNLALGDWRHRQEVNKLVAGIREGIAHIIFVLSSQSQLTWKECQRLIEFLRTYISPGEDFQLGKEEVYLISAVQYSISNNLTLPEFDKNFSKELQKYLKNNEPTNEDSKGFKCCELWELIRLNYIVATHKAAHVTNINSIQGLDVPSDMFKEDEDFYFTKDLFAFLRIHLFSNPKNYTNDENVVRRFHSMFTDFITYMPMKVKEMKIKSEDAAKTANLYQNQGFPRPSNLPHDYESFLECLGTFYYSDNLGLTMDYFSSEVNCLPLNKLARGACIDVSSMFVPNAKLLTGLAHGAPNEIFELLKQNGHNFSFDHFFESIMKYLSNFGNSQHGFNGPSLYTSEAFQKVVMDAMRVSINPAEINGICAYLDLVQSLCDHSEKVKTFFTNQKLPWIRINLFTAKIRGIPREIRAKMVAAAASMISSHCSPETANSLWEMFYNVRLVGQENGDLKDELEEHESRLETFPLTLSMLKLLQALVNSRFRELDEAPVSDNAIRSEKLDNGNFDNYLSYVRDYVLIKAPYRCYKNINERWQITSAAVNVLSRLLDFVPHLMYELLCGSTLLRTILTAIVDCIRAREASFGDAEEVDTCSYACLNLIRKTLSRQGSYLQRREFTVQQESVIVGLQEVLMKVISETGRPEYMLAILKFIDNLYPEGHKQAALDILALAITNRDDVDNHLYAAVISDANLTAVLKLTFINCLYYTDADENMRKTILKIIRVSVPHQVPNFAMLMLGVDKKVDFQNPGVSNYPRTVLHSLLDNAQNLPDAFVTLLTLVRDPRLWNPLLRYLKTNQFLSNFFREHFPSPSISMEDIGYLLKCAAVELKTTPQPGHLAHTIIEVESGKFQEILNMLELDQQTLEMPHLEFFDEGLVMQAMQSCEYIDTRLKIKSIKVDMLDAMLKEEILKLERNAVLRLRNTVHAEAKAIVEFATQLNEFRQQESTKINIFDGWRQVLEILVVTPGTLKLAGVDFVTSILRIILIKVVGMSSPNEFFCRLAAETVLTLCAVMGTFKDAVTSSTRDFLKNEVRAITMGRNEVKTSTIKDQVNASTLNVILGYICKWISEEHSPRVRATLYAAVLHVVQMFENANEAGSSCANSFSLILDHLCKDCCQSPEIGKVQAMYLMGEIIRLTTTRGLGGGETMRSDDMYSRNSETASRQLTSVSFYKKKSNIQEVGDASIQDSSMHPNMSSSFSKFQDSSIAGASQGFATSFTRGSGRVMDYLPAHSNIMTYMFAKGFLGNLVDAIIGVDDVDLVQLFSNQPTQSHMKSLLVFEAKLSLLCRFAGTGQKAILLLMDINVVHKLADMQIFTIRYYQDDSFNFTTQHGKQPQDVSSNRSSLSRKTTMDSIFSSVLKLFHVMVDSASKNVLLIQQIWHFLTVHDIAVSNLMGQSITSNDDSAVKNVSYSLLISLLAKTAKMLPAKALSSGTSIMPRMLQIFKIQAIHPDHTDDKLNLLKDAVMFLYNYATNKDAIKLNRKGKDVCCCRVVLKNNQNPDMLVGNPEEELNLGVLVQIVSDVAHLISGSHAAGTITAKKQQTAVLILEAGLTLIYYHVELFLGLVTTNFDDYHSTAKQFRDDFIPALDNKLVKHISDAIKVIPCESYLEMLLLRLRRLIHAPSKR